MKSFIRFLAALATVLFVLVAVIKFVQRCSWKEAVGILEEFCKEAHGSCCSRKGPAEEDIPEEA
ncbi:hypothetical protein LLG96_16290 [bacterium]|nr:hypothetical protein [bacterium]